MPFLTSVSSGQHREPKGGVTLIFAARQLRDDVMPQSMLDLLALRTGLMHRGNCRYESALRPLGAVFGAAAMQAGGKQS